MEICPICKGKVSPARRSQSSTEALENHIRLTHTKETK